MLSPIRNSAWEMDLSQGLQLRAAVRYFDLNIRTDCYMCVCVFFFCRKVVFHVTTFIMFCLSGEVIKFYRELKIIGQGPELLKITSLHISC